MEKVETEKLLDRVLEQKIAILDCDTQKVTESVIVDDICEGFGMQLKEREDGMIYLCELPDNHEWADELGTTLYEVLNALNSYTECFNDLSSQYEAWESDFLFYFGERTYYGLFDEQLGGFKATYTATNKKEIYEQGADRVFQLASKEELEGIDVSYPKKVCEAFGYSAKEITKEQAEIIRDSDEIGLLTIVSGIESDEKVDEYE